MGQTSREWWDATKSDEDALHGWLQDQHRGESTAGMRIRAARDLFSQEGDEAWSTLTRIAQDEDIHAEWILGLLDSRGVSPEARREERYWLEVLEGMKDLETACAVGAHAEAMRLERIMAIAEDTQAPPDIRRVFSRILGDELFHERAFRLLAGADAMSNTEDSHKVGRLALGLTP